jgi:hypothetical protein
MKLSYNLGVLVSLLSCSSSSLAFQQTETSRPSITAFQKRSTTSLFAVNNNVVLRPSEEKAAFDNLKIGGCTVHRYKRENDPDVDYVMWYHGRSEEQDSDKSLPNLSTGRIGRATSKNGLSWKRDTLGSNDVDMEGVSLGLNTESWWGFDTAHVGLGQVLLPMTTPAVMAEGGVYLMFFHGGSFDETPIGDYTDKEMPADAKIQGMKMKIGVALSQDGKTWGRIEGDDPTGACVSPYDASDPNTQELASLRDDNGKLLNLEEELYCGWPEVVPIIDEKKPENSGFFMYYSTMTKKDKAKSIGCAVSEDGFRWDPRGICLRPDEGTMDAGGVARCNAFQNAVYDEATESWANAKGYTMLYEGVSKEDNKHRVMMAESMDGRKWTKKGVVFDVGADDEAWDSQGVGSPHILR